MHAKTHEGRHTAPWQYGAQVTGRAPLRDGAAFHVESERRATVGWLDRTHREAQG